MYTGYAVALTKKDFLVNIRYALAFFHRYVTYSKIDHSREFFAKISLTRADISVDDPRPIVEALLMICDHPNDDVIINEANEAA